MVLINRIDAVRCGIGEGALWDEAEQRLYLVDIMAGQIVRYDPATDDVHRFDVGQIIGSMALREGGGAIVGLASGVHHFDFESGTAELLVDLEPDDRSLLLSEGKADPVGRFVVSSFSMAMSEPAGTYYGITAGKGPQKLRSAIVVPNGLAWSPNGKTIYYADSALKQVFAADYDLESGTLSGERPFILTHEMGGIPDGATTDTDGNYWVTICQAGLVACFDPEGSLLRTIELPSKWVSSVAFGGPELDRLFVTTLDPALMKMGDDPLGGCLFVVDDLNVRGFAASRSRV